LDKTLKYKIITVLVLFMLVVILLSASLSGLLFEPGMSLPQINYEQERSIRTGEPDSNTYALNNLLRNILIITVAAVLLFLTIYKIQTKKAWKELGSVIKYSLVIIAVLTILILLLMFVFPRTSTVVVPETMVTQHEEKIEVPTGETPAALYWVLGFMVTGLAAFLVIKIVLSGRKTDRIQIKIEAEALNARNAIKRGDDLKSVIINYYCAMCSVLRDEEDIERKSFMTAGEFEKKLLSTGAPEKPVHDITLLFESVRYGNLEPDSSDEKIAVRCFDNIIDFFRKQRVTDEKK
jgi:hypothetical protein